MLSLFHWYAADIKAGKVTRSMPRSVYHRNNPALWGAYWAALPCVPAVAAPAPAPAPAPGSASAPAKPVFFHLLWLTFRTFFGSLFSLFMMLLRPRTPAPPAVAPPAGPPVHALRLSAQVAGAGQTVQGRLLDRSLDFTTVNPAFFSIYLHVSPPPGALGMIYHRVPNFRLIGPQELEFRVPPVGTANPALMVPPDNYIVLCRYGFWSVESDQLLRVM
ncbi:MAG: hypothetical protein HY736_18320 [Verrucomicrobia bacterium]|nr:hypothetical protein [Verrucomicrobiota bacterium]